MLTFTDYRLGKIGTFRMLLAPKPSQAYERLAPAATQTTKS